MCQLLYLIQILESTTWLNQKTHIIHRPSGNKEFDSLILEHIFQEGSQGESHPIQWMRLIDDCKWVLMHV